MLNLGWDLQKIVLANRYYTTHRHCMTFFFRIASVFCQASLFLLLLLWDLNKNTVFALALNDLKEMLQANCCFITFYTAQQIFNARHHTRADFINSHRGKTGHHMLNDRGPYITRL